VTPRAGDAGAVCGNVTAGAGLRDRLLLLAALAWGWLAVGTELLGAVGWLERGPLLAWWCLGLGGALALARPWTALAVPHGPTRPATWALAAPLVFLLGWSFLQAWLSPPNNIDSLQYHLPRQVYWQQAGRVDHFPTNELRQLTMPPLAEYAGLHLLVVTGGDRWHNLVQWSSLVLTALAASLITRDLGGGAFAQVLTATLVVSAPPALAEASNTKNDLVVAFWLTLTALWALRLARSPRPWPSAPWMPALLGLCFGCLALTKGTGIVLGSPVAVLAAVGMLRSRPWSIVGAALLAAAINAPHVSRNWRAFGSPYGAEVAAHGERVTNELLTPAVLVSNVARNLARQAVLPLPRWNASLERGVAWLHEELGLSPDDPRTTFRRPPWGRLSYGPANEDTATAPVHTFLLLCVPLLLAGTRRGIDGRGVLVVWALAAVAFLVFCAVFKWQLWHSRLLVPVLALGAPSVALVCAAPRRLLGVLAAVAALAAAVPTLGILQRPLLGPRSILREGRAALYFHGAPELAAPGKTLFGLVGALEPKVVGLAEDWYVFMGPLLERSPSRPRFASFNARFNPNHVAEPPSDVLLSASAPPARVLHVASGRWYVAVARAGPFSLSVPEAAVADVLKRLRRFDAGSP
jgi:hypothetical protein